MEGPATSLRHSVTGLRLTGDGYATVLFCSWISWRLHTRIGSRSFAATASAAARAPLIVVMHGTRYVTALRRICFSSANALGPVVVQIASWMLPPLSRSTALGRPSFTLNTVLRVSPPHVTP